MRLLRGFYISADTQKRSRRTLVLVHVPVIVIFLLFYFFPLDKNHFYPPCMWYYATKTYCPGCGSMRGINQMIHGNLLGLIQNNLMAALMVPYLFYQYIVLIVRSFFRYQLPTLFLSRIEILLLGASFVLYGIIRNFVPFLAPK